MKRITSQEQEKKNINFEWFEKIVKNNAFAHNEQMLHCPQCFQY